MEECSLNDRILKILCSDFTYDFGKSSFQFRETNLKSASKYREIEELYRSFNKSLSYEDFQRIPDRFKLAKGLRPVRKEKQSINLKKTPAGTHLEITYNAGKGFLELLFLGQDPMFKFYVITNKGSSFTPMQILYTSKDKLIRGEGFTLYNGIEETVSDFVKEEIGNINDLSLISPNHVMKVLDNASYDITPQQEWYIGEPAMRKFDFSSVSETLITTSAFKLTFDLNDLMTVRYFATKNFTRLVLRSAWKRYFPEQLKMLEVKPVECNGKAVFKKGKWQIVL